MNPIFEFDEEMFIYGEDYLAILFLFFPVSLKLETSKIPWGSEV